MLWLSQVAPGKKNGLSLRVYGSKAGIEWAQENPNYLKFSIPNKHTIIRGKEDLKNYNNLVQLTRTPPGHPDGFIESFANIYQEISEAILDYRKGQKICHKTIFPNFSDGIDGMKFIEAAIKSNKMNSKWINLNYN